MKMKTREIQTICFVMLVSFLFGEACFGKEPVDNENVRYQKFDDSWFQGENVLTQREPNLYGTAKTVENGGRWHCDGTTDGKMNAACWSVTLNQTKPTPILISGESRLVSGLQMHKSSDYSLYVDVVYSDNSPGWGITANFSGTADWEYASRIFAPSKPIRALSFYCMYRNRGGAVEFRNVKLIQADNEADCFMFDDTMVTQRRERTTDGNLRFYLRDVAEDSSWETVSNTEKTLGFTLNHDATTLKNNTVLNCVKIRSLTEKNRCATLVVAFPVAPADSVNISGTGKANRAFWGLNRSTDIEENATREFSETYPTAGGMKRMNRFPIQGVGVTDGTEKWIGIDPDYPALYRTFFNAKTQELCLAYDLGFTPEKSEWELRFCTFQQPSGGMRYAWKRYMETYPSAFTVRVPKMGVWMPFAQISKVTNHEDFGFVFKEGTDEPTWDDLHGMLTFRYTEPMTWWMPMKGDNLASMNPQNITGEEMKKILLSGGAEARRLAKEGHTYAKSWENAVMYDAEQKPYGKFLDTPWCRGIVWSMASLPGVEGGHFQANWNEHYVTKTYPKLHDGEHYMKKWRATDNFKGIDGEYIDSSEGYVTAELDFRAEHFSAVTTPLTFSLEMKTPAILRGLVTFEYIRNIERDVHAAGKLMMANSTPSRLSWLAPIIDVLGTETNWNWNGKWSPMSIEELQYRRMLCGGKPFCFLQNTDFTKFSYDCSERFMKRSLAFGMFPGYFSADASTGHYFSNPELYERDRPLFKKYIPLCRLVAEAGWEPITGVRVTEPRLLIERFGNPETNGGVYYLTVFNPESEQLSAKLTDFAPELIGEIETLIGSSTLASEDVWLIKVTVNKSDCK